MTQQLFGQQNELVHSYFLVYFSKTSPVLTTYVYIEAEICNSWALGHTEWTMHVQETIQWLTFLQVLFLSIFSVIPVFNFYK